MSLVVGRFEYGKCSRLGEDQIYWVLCGDSAIHNVGMRGGR